MIPWEGLHELLRSPLRGRVGGHGEVDGPTAIMREHNEDEEHPERGCRHDKEVSRHQVCHVVFQEGLPSLGRWSSIMGNRNSQFEQLAVDAGCSPAWIGKAHLAN